MKKTYKFYGNNAVKHDGFNPEVRKGMVRAIDITDLKTASFEPATPVRFAVSLDEGPVYVIDGPMTLVVRCAETDDPVSFLLTGEFRRNGRPLAHGSVRYYRLTGNCRSDFLPDAVYDGRMSFDDCTASVGMMERFLAKLGGCLGQFEGLYQAGK